MADIQETVQQLIKLGADAAKPREVPNGNIPYALVPAGFNIVNLQEYIHNKYAATPIRVQQNVSVLDAESFVEYYTLFHDPNSRVFAYEPDVSVEAILDYHAAGEGTARWGEHTIKLTLRKSPEWERWIKSNNQQFDQVKFAEFLEQNSIDITSPSPAAMMDVARDLEVKTDVEFGAGIRMQDGQVRFRYTETTKGTVGGGQLDVPERFILSIPVFVGGDAVNLEALLRYRVKEGKLVIFYTLVRPEEAIRKAFLATRDKIADELSITIINGTTGL